MSDTNLGRDFVQHRPTCRCDDCHADRLQSENRKLKERIAELETGLAKQAASAKMGMGAAKASALAAERNAERLHSECRPEALDAERSTNEKLTKYIAELEEALTAISTNTLDAARAKQVADEVLYKEAGE